MYVESGELRDNLLKMQGAREMLAFLLNEIDNNDEFLSIDIKIKKGKKEHFNAIKRLILKDGINVQNYMNKRKIMFRNHERTEKGKLKKVEAYFR